MIVADHAFGWVVAHQGGWDEVLLFAGPVLLALLVLRWADRRAKARVSEDERDDRRS